MRLIHWSFTLISLSFGLPVFAQLVITSGEEFKSKPVEKYYSPRIVEASAAGYTFMQLNGEDLIFRQFDANHQPISTDQARHLLNKWRFVPHSFLKLGDKTYAFQSVYNVRNKHWELRAGTLEGTKLSDVRALLSYPYHDQARTGKLFGGLFTRYNSASKFTTNEAGTRFAFLHNDNYERGKNDPVKMRAFVFNEQLNEVWSGTFTLPFTDRQWSILNMRMAPDGRLFVLARTRKEVPTGNRNKMEAGPWEPMVCIITDTKEEYVPLTVDGSFVHNSFLELTASGCEVTGVYVDDTSRKRLGAFRATLTAGNTEISVTKFPLSDEDLARGAYKDGDYYLTDYDRDAQNGQRKLFLTPVDIILPSSSSGYNTYRSDGFYAIQINPSAEVAEITYTRTNAHPFSDQNIFADGVTIDGQSYVLFAEGGKAHLLGRLGADGTVTNPQAVVKPGKPDERLYQHNYRVVDRGLFLLLGYGKKARGSYVRFRK